MASEQMQQKTFTCFKCQQPIRLQRNADNTGWLHFNLDGSDHVHEKKSGFPSKTAAVATDLSRLEGKMDLILKELQVIHEQLKGLQQQQQQVASK